MCWALPGARRLKMETTGNAGGVHNLTIDPGEQGLGDDQEYRRVSRNGTHWFWD